MCARSRRQAAPMPARGEDPRQPARQRDHDYLGPAPGRRPRANLSMAARSTNGRGGVCRGGGRAGAVRENGRGISNVGIIEYALSERPQIRSGLERSNPSRRDRRKLHRLVRNRLTASFSSPRGFGFSCQIILQFERLNRGYFFREGATLRGRACYHPCENACNRQFLLQPNRRGL
jgi:hypothetical protein